MKTHSHPKTEWQRPHDDGRPLSPSFFFPPLALSLSLISFRLLQDPNLKYLTTARRPSSLRGAHPEGTERQDLSNNKKKRKAGIHLLLHRKGNRTPGGAAFICSNRASLTAALPTRPPDKPTVVTALIEFPPVTPQLPVFYGCKGRLAHFRAGGKPGPIIGAAKGVN